MTANQISYSQAQTNARNVDENIRSHQANEAQAQRDLDLKREELQHRKAVDWVGAVFGR